VAIAEDKIINYAMILCLGLLVGWLCTYLYYHDTQIDESCLADLIEEKAQEGLDRGYYFAAGIGKGDNTVDAMIKWYFHYGMISRSLLEKEIGDGIRRCRK